MTESSPISLRGNSWRLSGPYRDCPAPAVGRVNVHIWTLVLLKLLHRLGIPKDRLLFAVYENPTLASAAKRAHDYLGLHSGGA